MTTQYIEYTLKKFKPFLRNHYKVKKIGFFGSYARNQASKNSDIDILVDFSEPLGLEFFELKDFLEEKLQRKVDLVTPAALKPQLKKNILKEIFYV